MHISHPDVHLDRDYMWFWQIDNDTGQTVAVSSGKFFYKTEAENDLEQFLTALGTLQI